MSVVAFAVVELQIELVAFDSDWLEDDVAFSGSVTHDHDVIAAQELPFSTADAGVWCHQAIYFSVHIVE